MNEEQYWRVNFCYSIVVFLYMITALGSLVFSHYQSERINLLVFREAVLIHQIAIKDKQIAVLMADCDKVPELPVPETTPGL